MKKSVPLVHAYVVEQLPHPMVGPAPFALVMWESEGWRQMDRRRIKREEKKAVRKWRKAREVKL
ncbi:MAG TPA: hypothetical protein VFP43_22550 [Mesorhizobium sp.]|nr:hypothetical protein [Mesorhizobium sp.]